MDLWFLWEKTFYCWYYIEMDESFEQSESSFFDYIKKAFEYLKQLILGNKTKKTNQPENEVTDPILAKLSSLRKINGLDSQVLLSNLKNRFDKDPNAELDKYRVTWSQENVKLFNDYIDRAKKYLDEHRTLSRQDFRRFFWWNWMVLAAQELMSNCSMEGNWKFWQKNVWNCYLLAAIRSIIQSPLYEHFICTSVSYDKDKDQFTVKIPLWNLNAKSYVISKDLLEPQKNVFYEPGKKISPQIVPLQEVRRNTKTKKYEEQYDKNWNPKLFRKSREYLYPVNAPKWIQALEVAYLLATTDKNWKIDRLKMEGGHWNDALEKLLWTNNTDKSTILINRNRVATKKFFDTFHPLTSYATISTTQWKNGDDIRYKVRWTEIQLFHRHAYTIIDTDPIKKTVTLVNPSAITEGFELTYEQVMENFFGLRICKADLINWFK